MSFLNSLVTGGAVALMNLAAIFLLTLIFAPGLDRLGIFIYDSGDHYQNNAAADGVMSGLMLLASSFSLSATTVAAVDSLIYKRLVKDFAVERGAFREV